MPAPGSELAALLAARLPGVTVAACAVGSVLPDPRDTGIAGAHPRRLATFAAGRAAARKALGADVALPMGPDRLPVWPHGWRGSISHTDHLALAIAAQGFVSLAIDVEQDGRVRRDLWPTLFSDGEASAPGFDPTRAFAAKEALFKLLHPLTGQWFGFHDACATVASDCVTLRLNTPVGEFPEGWHTSGPAVAAEGHVTVALWLN